MQRQPSNNGVCISTMLFYVYLFWYSDIFSLSVYIKCTTVYDSTVHIAIGKAHCALDRVVAGFRNITSNNPTINRRSNKEEAEEQRDHDQIINRAVHNKLTHIGESFSIFRNFITPHFIVLYQVLYEYSTIAFLLLWFMVHACT